MTDKNKETNAKIEKLCKQFEKYECEGQMSFDSPEIKEFFGIDDKDEEEER